MSHPSGPSPFRFCPSCGRAAPGFFEGRRLRCEGCGFEYFHNVATAAGVILDCAGRVVFIERAREPRRGCLGLPGGFVDPQERAEAAAIRECLEEIGWAPPSLSFIGSFPNVYEFGGVSYNTCDLFFYYRLRDECLPAFAPADGEGLSVRLVEPSRLREGELAFPSLGLALAEYAKL
jgi:NAD+ diphosphatase